jgi:hypothetical protein
MPTDSDFTQRAVLGALIEAHPRLMDMDTLVGLMPDLPDVDFAVRQLIEDGLATRLGGRVGITRAAARFDQLDPI